MVDAGLVQTDSVEFPPKAGPGDLAVALRWRLVEGGALEGVVQIENVSAGPVLFARRPPGLTPLGLDGQQLPTECITATVALSRPEVVLASGQRAEARAVWAGWNGASASGTVVVGIDGYQFPVSAAGPAQPEPVTGNEATNLSSSWFEVVPQHGN